MRKSRCPAGHRLLFNRLWPPVPIGRPVRPQVGRAYTIRHHCTQRRRDATFPHRADPGAALPGSSRNESPSYPKLGDLFLCHSRSAVPYLPWALHLPSSNLHSGPGKTESQCCHSLRYIPGGSLCQFACSFLFSLARSHSCRVPARPHPAAAPGATC